jgi:hypothetical protein
MIRRHAPSGMSWQKLIAAVAAVVVPIVLALMGQDVPTSAIPLDADGAPTRVAGPGE